MPKILITDDQVFMRMMLKRILIEEKYEILEASNGQEAIDQFEANSPDLVLMDMTMPVMDGLTATRAIKSAHPNAIIVMCTAVGQQSMVVEAVKAGVKDFIVKPFKPERVVSCVQRFVG